MVNSKAPYIRSISGCKFVAVFLIFWYHSALPNYGIDIGARITEILFVVSGFCVSYNWFYSLPTPSYATSFEYVYKKVKKFWPLHALMTTFVLFYGLKNETIGFSIKMLVSLALNLSLLQAWSPDESVFFSFNGASWFLSAILFCYFISPVLMQTVKRKNTILFLISAIIFRILISEIDIMNPEIFGWTEHVYPLVRAVEFYIGMLLVPWFISLRDKFCDSNWSTNVLFSFLEIAVTCIYIFVSISKNEIWPRSYFVVFASALILVISFDKGILSKALSTYPLQKLSDVQFEFYILHQTFIICFENALRRMFKSLFLTEIILFLLILGSSFLIKKVQCFFVNVKSFARG